MLTSLDESEIPAPTPLPTSVSAANQLNQAASQGVKSNFASAAKPETENGDESKRYIPDHKKPDAALTFPEKVSLEFLYGVLNFDVARRKSPLTFSPSFVIISS